MIALQIEIIKKEIVIIFIILIMGLIIIKEIYMIVG